MCWKTEYQAIVLEPEWWQIWSSSRAEVLCMCTVARLCAIFGRTWHFLMLMLFFVYFQILEVLRLVFQVSNFIFDSDILFLFSTLFFSSRIRDIMRNPTIFFLNCSRCLWDAASKSHVLPRTGDITGSRKNHTLFASHLFPRTPSEPAPCLFWENFLTLMDQNPSSLKTIQYQILKNVTDNNLGDLASAVFCDAMHHGTYSHCKSSRVSRTSQKTQLSLSM